MRRCGDWLETYLSRVIPTSESDPRYHLWAGATIISSVLKRNAFLQRNYKLYPNLYVVLVGPPGCGKGAALNPAFEIVKACGIINTLTDRLTVPYIIERVSKGFSSPVPTTPGVQIPGSPPAPGTGMLGIDHAVMILTSELPVLLGDPTELKYWSDLWDSRETQYEYGTRGGGQLLIPKTSFNILAGVTPSGIGESIPPASISGGFTRRIVFIYSHGRHKNIPWPKPPPPTDDLIEDLRHIATHIRGAFEFADESARHAFEKVYLDSKPGDVEEEFISHFKSTKWVHATKFAMALSASRDDSMKITEKNMEKAIEEMDLVEKSLLRVFRCSGASDQANLMELFLGVLYKRGYASRTELSHVLWRHFSGHEDLARIIQLAGDTGYICEVSQGSKQLLRLTHFGETYAESVFGPLPPSNVGGASVGGKP